MMAPKRFAPAQRFLHWLMAACIITMLFLGVGMVSTVAPKYLTLVQIHKSLGIGILILALIRLSLRFVYGAPELPSDLPPLIKVGAKLSEYGMYSLMIGMPLIGWGMLSSASHPVALFGSVHLFPILPVYPEHYALLRQAHMYLAFVFFATILLHMSALLFHKFVRKDGVFETMAPLITENQQIELDSKHV
jgi:cytochrome b561